MIHRRKIFLHIGLSPPSRQPTKFQQSSLRLEVQLFKIVAVLGMDMHFCDPNQLIATKQRNKLAAANKALC